jgi:hypothetical protein
MTDNGQVLSLLEKKITDRLAQKRLPKGRREDLEIQQLFVLYLREDHRKVNIMWSYFQPLAWAGAIIVTALITMAATGKISMVLIP